MATSLSFDDVLTDIYSLEVYVETIKDKVHLMVKGGDKLPLQVQNAIRQHRDALIKYYSDPDLLQDELLKMRKYAELEIHPDLQVDYWDRYYKILEARKANMCHPWAKIPEDHQRCPKCPWLGKKETPNGYICETKCRK